MKAISFVLPAAQTFSPGTPVKIPAQSSVSARAKQDSFLPMFFALLSQLYCTAGRIPRQSRGFPSFPGISSLWGASAPGPLNLLVWLKRLGISRRNHAFHGKKKNRPRGIPPGPFPCSQRPRLRTRFALNTACVSSLKTVCPPRVVRFTLG